MATIRDCRPMGFQELQQGQSMKFNKDNVSTRIDTLTTAGTGGVHPGSVTCGEGLLLLWI